MFLSNFLGLAMGVVMVSARAIGDIKFPSQNPSSSIPECAFHPHNHLTHSLQRPISPDTYTNIPTHAWPHITSLLLTHSNPLTSASPITRNNVQTLRLSSLTNDVTLESVVLGLVFTTPENIRAENLELRDENTIGEREAEKRCLEEAVRNVGAGKQVEGVLDIEGKGKMGFLVYRVD